MISVEYLAIAMVCGFIILLYILYVKDAKHTQNIRSIATVIEKLQREIYTLDKKIEQELTLLSDMIPDEKSLHVKEQVLEQMSEMGGVINSALEEIEQSFESYKQRQDKRLLHLEQGLKNLSLPSSVSGMDDEKILSLYNQGVGVETIAKELLISKAEVEFVLKINQLQ